jgi:TonB family protein
MLRVFALAAVLLLASSAALADLRSPVGKWVVIFDDARCVAGRNYGSVQKPVLLVLKQPAHRSVMQLQWIAKGGRTAPQQSKGTVQFDQQPPVDVSLLLYYAKDKGQRVYQLNVPIDRFTAAGDAHRVHLHAKWLEEDLELSSLAPLLKTMDRCVSDLRNYWNVTDDNDRDAPVAGLKSRAKGDLRRFFSSDDYPWMALIKDQEGQVQFSILIDEKGRVADCSVIEPSGVAVLDAQSCAILTERASFTPAIGTDGKPARDSYISRIVWRTE